MADKPKAEPTLDLTLSGMVKALSQPVPPRLVKQLRQHGEVLDYIEWHTAARMLDHFCAGRWSKEIVDSGVSVEFDTKTRKGPERRQYVWCRIRVTLYGTDQTASRESFGCERLDTGFFGDPFTNAEAQAFKRAAAHFGLARHLYSD